MQDQKNQPEIDRAELTDADLAAIHRMEHDIIEAVSKALDAGTVQVQHAIQSLMHQGATLLMVSAGDSGASKEEVLDVFDAIVQNVRDNHITKGYEAMIEKAQELRTALAIGDDQ